jgi:hypothetical protein
LEKGASFMSDHKHGEMDISVQEKTFDGFIKTGVWSSVIVIALLIFLAFVGI